MNYIILHKTYIHTQRVGHRVCFTSIYRFGFYSIARGYVYNDVFKKIRDPPKLVGKCHPKHFNTGKLKFLKKFILRFLQYLNGFIPGCMFCSILVKYSFSSKTKTKITRYLLFL